MAPLFTFRLIPTIASMLGERGVDAAGVLRDAGVAEAAARGPITAPLPRIQRVIELAAERLDAPLFGLDLAERIHTGVYGVPEFLVRSAPTVERALHAICEFAVLVNPILDFRIRADDSSCQLGFAIAAHRDGLGAHLNEYSIAFVVRQAATVLGRPLPLERAWFAHARPRHAEAVATRLACDVAFQTAECGFAIPRQLLAESPRTADAPLFEYFLDQARTQLRDLRAVDAVSQIARAIDDRLPDGDYAAAAIATALSIPLRSLQRHLADAGTTYRDVLEHVRLRRRAALRRAGVDETEIARRLGFGDARAMRRSLDEPPA